MIEMNTKAEIINCLKGIDDINHCDYAVELREFAQKLYQKDGALFPINLFCEIIEDVDIDLFIRFNAYYTLSIYYRRHENKDEFRDLVNKYSDFFNEKAYNEACHLNPYNNINLSLYHMYLSNKNNSHITIALEEAQKALNHLKNNRGVCQTYADIFATALEHGRKFSEADNQYALDIIDKAIYLKDDYAKYYCTKGRLKFYIGDNYDESFRLIEKAIELEDKTKSDSIFRVSQYYYYLLDLKAKLVDLKAEKNAVEIKNTLGNYQSDMKILLDRNKDDIENMKSKYLEFLAFFAAILAFIISSIQVMKNVTGFRESAALILVLVGGLNISFSLFRLLMDHNNNKKTYITTSVILTTSIAVIVLMFLFS